MNTKKKQSRSQSEKLPARKEAKPPKILSVEESKRYLDLAWSTKYAAYFVLRLWSGLRDCEVRSLDLEKDLNVERRVIFVRDRWSLRVVQLTTAVVDMLRALQAAGRLNAVALVPPTSAVSIFLKKSGLEATDLRNLRATAITYHHALHGDLAKTCQWAGISMPVFEHLVSCVSHADASAFWALMPSL